MNSDSLARLRERFKDESFAIQYRKWANNPVTQEIFNTFKESFCRPLALGALSQLPPTATSGERALYAQGFNSGAWGLLHVVLNATELAVSSTDEPKATYQTDEEKEGQEKTKQKGG